jgi:hypothetical protein
MGKCSSPAEVLVTSRRKVICSKRLGAEARHQEKQSKLARIHRAFELLAEKSIDFDRRSGNDRRMQLAKLDIKKSKTVRLSMTRAERLAKKAAKKLIRCYKSSQLSFSKY